MQHFLLYEIIRKAENTKIHTILANYIILIMRKIIPCELVPLWYHWQMIKIIFRF